MRTQFSGPESRKQSINTRLTFISASVVLAALLASSLPVIAQEPQAPRSGVKRTDLQRHDLSVPGREVIQARVDFPPGVESPTHSHPGEEIVYTIGGRLEYRLEGKPLIVLHQ